MNPKIGIGIYGSNGHQVHARLVDDPLAVCAATAAFDPALLPPVLRASTDIPHYTGLDELLGDERVDLVCLCSPRRCDQARETVRCLEAGKHVYAEKPCALTEADLDAIFTTVTRTGRQFHEMAGTAFAQPYLGLRQVVSSGVLGQIVQVRAQKSYPYHDRRPQDEDVDGGMLLQAGVQALRFVEHVAGLKIESIEALETCLGNPHPGQLRMAAAVNACLQGGALASIAVNYLNQVSSGQWGNDELYIFGTDGFVESVEGGARTRLVLASPNPEGGSLSLAEPSQDYLTLFLQDLLHGVDMPLSLADELSPTRWIIRAKQGARLVK